ncbi:MAG: Smr/MutS family protein, partial [Fimbriimonadales bacterium]
RSQPNVRLQKAQSAATEIHLRAMRAEDAERELDRFIDDAVLAGLDSVRIVHGKGEGVLRKVTQDYLKRHPHVRSFRTADAGEGGDGVTIAVFR